MAGSNSDDLVGSRGQGEAGGCEGPEEGRGLRLLVAVTRKKNADACTQAGAIRRTALMLRQETRERKWVWDTRSTETFRLGHVDH